MIRPATLRILERVLLLALSGKIFVYRSLLGVIFMFNQTIKDTYTVESVTSGHPDKVCDQISDAILDALLEKDPKARVAVEAFGSHGLLVIGGEVTSTAQVDYALIAKEIYKTIGYNDPLEIITRVETQAPEIAQGVDTGGAGDQGIMYGFATNETKEFLPKGVVFTQALARKLEETRRSGEISWLMPDGKTQVTIENGKVSAVVVSAQHQAGISELEINQTIREKIIRPVLGEEMPETIFINPTGSFVTGGFTSDAGLTGRKIMVDTYGGLAPHGGGAFSGKDATKVDRSAAYMARFAAKNLVAAGYGKQVLVSVSYAIGRAEPVQVTAYNEEGTSLKDIVTKNFDFKPQAIIERLGLRNPIFKQTAAYGHFGKAGLPWEEIISLS
jgi:S-adenosylmethionine synthetase